MSSDEHLQATLEATVTMLQQDPRQAVERAEAMLAREPTLRPALEIRAIGRRLMGEAEQAVGLFDELLASGESSAHLQHEYGMALGAAGRADDAVAALRRAVDIDPRHAGAWRALGDQLSAVGQRDAAEDAYERHLALTTRHPELAEAAALLRQGQVARAETLTRSVLKKDPTDVVAIRLLASIGIKVGQLEDARKLLERCLELAPDFHLARHGYAVVLFRRHDLEGALAEVETLLRAEPSNPNYLVLKGSILVRKGDHEEALELYERLLRHHPGEAGAQLNYGHTLKTVGRLDDGIAAYRESIRLAPATGEAWWSLANLKTYRFSDAEIDAMRNALDDGGDPEDQAHLAFALGKAFEDRGEYDASFDNYALGNRTRSRQHRHNARANTANTARQIRVCTKTFFEERSGWGCDAPDPVFIVGLPRAGSTLLEQILASHSQVEGTAELPDIIALSRKLGNRTRQNPASDYPEILARLDRRQVQELGESYLRTSAVQRHGLPYFIDKMPNNFQHIGLIHLILPRAKIIDARRHPLAGCFSCFKQLFARGQNFTYDLTDLGRYYRDYVALMDHWDSVLPGRVLRMQYEDMVADSETQIRRLLDYCGLPFEEQCLRFWENRRAVRTPSAEQVRQPIYRAGLAQWRHFEHRLEPLKTALGPVLDRYPVD